MTSASTVPPSGRVHHARRQLACGSTRPSPSIGATFWTFAIGGWLASGDSYWLFNFSYIGTSVTLGMGLYSALVKPNKPWSRWCSWTCRTAIVLDLLRFERDRAGRLVRLSLARIADATIYVGRGPPPEWCDYRMGYAARTTYRRPSRLRRVVNGCVAWLAGQGFTPGDTVRLEVAGRKTGNPRAFAVTMAYCGNEYYLVSLAGESEWVRNLRAADGKAVIQHRRRFDVRALELPPDARAAVLAAYLSKRALSKSAVDAARDYFAVDAHPSLEALQGIADHYPVFKVIGNTQTLSGKDQSQHR